MLAYVAVILLKTTIISSLVCNEILEAPENQKWSLVNLQSAAPKELIECLAHLSKEKLGTAEGSFIWQTIVKFYDGVPNIPEQKLMQLHWVTVAIPPEDYYNLTLNSIDVIENFGLDYGLSHEQLSAIADRIREDWGGKDPEDYSYYDLISLRQILCAFNKSEIERIHPAAYKEAAAVLGKLTHCNPEVLQGLALLAVNKNAFGPAKDWDKSKIEAIGVVADYASEKAMKMNQQTQTETKQ